MKKNLKFLSILVAVILVLTGCGTKKDAKTQLSDAIEKTKKMESAAIKLDVKAEMTSEGTTMALGLGMNGNVSGTGKDMKSHLNANVSFFGMNQETEMYTEVKDNYMYTYTKEDGKWTYTKEEYKEEETISTEKVTEILNKAKSIKEEKSDKKGYTKLVVTVGADTLNEAMKSETVSELAGETSAEIKNDLSFNVYLKDGYLSIVELDLGKFIKDSVSAEELEKGEIKAVISIELNDINKADKVTIPEEVTKNATEEKDTEISTDLSSLN